MGSLEHLLRGRLARAFEAVADEPVDPAVQRSQRADYQSNAALGLARQLKANPRDIATRVVAAVDLDDLCERVEVSGPGFINLTVSGQALDRMLGEITADDRLGVPVAEPETVRFGCLPTLSFRVGDLFAGAPDTEL